VAGGLVVALVVGVLAVVVVRKVVGGGAADQSKLGAVIVVPGYGGSVGDVAPIVRELEHQGRTAIAYRPSQGGTGDLEVQARRLGQLATLMMKQTGVDSVDLVGYSAGGVISRIYVRDFGGASVVRRVLTLGSPHHGTDVAAIAEEAAGGCPKACEQLATGSELLRKLNAKDETPKGPRWVTVRTAEDHVVTPVDSAELQGAINVEVQDLCPGAKTTHGGLPGDPVVLATLPRALGKGAPKAPRNVTC
jgi:pimeloyl-ACP methyl ester carboxylesterase